MNHTEQNKLIVNTTLLAGKLLMESGAETERVEDTMNHILKKAVLPEQMQHAKTFVLLNSIFINISPTQTSFHPIHKRSNNLGKITLVNQISRDYTAGLYSLEETYRLLAEVEKTKPAAISLLRIASAAVLGGTTALLFGGSLVDFPAAAVAGTVSYLVYTLISTYIDIPFVCEFCAAFVAGIFGLLAMQVIGENSNTIMMGAVIVLAPGIAITNAIRDSMQRHYLTGIIRFLESLFIGASLGGGIALALLLFSRLV